MEFLKSQLAVAVNASPPVLLYNAAIAAALLAFAWVSYVLVRQFVLPDPGGLRGPSLVPLLGNLTSMDHWLNFEHDVAAEQQYGPVFRAWLLGTRYVVVSEPDVLRTVLQENWPRGHILMMNYVRAGYPDGLFAVRPPEEWKQQRKYMNPAFSYAKLKTAFPSIHAHGQNLHALLQGSIAKGEEVKLDETFVRFTFDIICELVLGKNFNSLVHPEGNMYQRFMDWNHVMQKGLDDKSPEVLYYKEVKRLRIPLKLDKVAATMRALIYDHAKACKEKLLSEGNSATIDGKKLEGTMVHMLLNTEDPKNPGHTLPLEIVTSQMVTLLFAGHDTTAHSMSLTVAEVFNNPHILKKVREELDSVLGDKQFPGPDDMKDLPYLEAVFKENMRLHTPGTLTFRRAPRDLSTPHGNIRKGDAVLLKFHAPHHNAAVHKHPDAFDPERWLGDRKAHTEKYTFFFGGGPRSCIGRNLAHIEARVVLGYLFKHYDVRAPKDLKLRQGLTVFPSDGLPVTLSPRKY